MKKLLIVLSGLAAMGLAACSSTPAGPKYDETIKAASGEDNIVTIAGPVLVSDDSEAGWEGANEKAYMTATSVAKVAEVSTAVADKLAGKSVEWIYMYQGVKIGSGKAGWTSKAKKGGEVVELDGSFAIKAIWGHVDAESESFIKTQWISDPHTAYAESLTEDTLFYPTWQEAADEEGFAWDQNPMCIGEAGTYTFVVAKYTTVSEAGKPGYGAALVRTGDATFPE